MHQTEGLRRFDLRRHTLMFWNNDRIKGRVTIPGNIQGNFAKVGFQVFFSETIPAVTAVFTRWIVFRIPKMFIYLSFQKRFNTLFIKLLSSISGSNRLRSLISYQFIYTKLFILPNFSTLHLSTLQPLN